jgi:hypothetical protein
MLFSIACLFGFLTVICTPGLIAQAREERSGAAATQGEA